MAEARRLPDLPVALTRSRVLAVALASAHAGAFALLYVSLAGGLFGVVALGLLLSNACWCIRRHALLAAAQSVVGVVLHGESGCRLQLRDGRTLDGRVQAATWVSTAMIVLHMRAGARERRAVVVLPDHVGAECFRRLRVRLRWCAIDAGGSGPTEPWL